MFIGPETYRRGPCRQALIEKALPADEREEGYVRHDLDSMSLNDVIDDARSMSLFAGSRLIWVSSAELALPRGRAAAAATAEEEEDAAPKAGGADSLAAYCKDPTPGTVLVLDSHRWDFEGEDKAKTDRLRKFYSAIQAVVEFAKLTRQDAMSFAQGQAAERGLRIGSAGSTLVEATAGDASRLATEIEAGGGAGGGQVTVRRLRWCRARRRSNLVNARGGRTESLQQWTR